MKTLTENKEFDFVLHSFTAIKQTQELLVVPEIPIQNVTYLIR